MVSVLVSFMFVQGVHDWLRPSAEQRRWTTVHLCRRWSLILKSGRVGGSTPPLTTSPLALGKTLTSANNDWTFLPLAVE